MITACVRKDDGLGLTLLPDEHRAWFKRRPVPDQLRDDRDEVLVEVFVVGVAGHVSSPEQESP